MRNYIFGTIFVLGLFVISLVSFPLDDIIGIGIYLLCILVFSFLCTVFYAEKFKPRYYMVIVLLIIFKSFAIYLDDLYDPITLLIGVPIDIVMTSFGSSAGFLIGKAVLWIIFKIREKVNSGQIKR